MTAVARIAAGVALAGIAFFVRAQTNDAGAAWRGTVVPPYGYGLQALSGTCVGEGPDGDSLCAIAISVVRDEQSHVRSVLASRMLRHPGGAPVGGDRPLSLVTDAIEPDVLYDTANEVAVGVCQRDGIDDPRIVAIVLPGADIEWFTDLRGSWRLDTAGRLQPIPPAGVRCSNEGFGYDG